jgi:hypothetical protein
MHLLNSIRITKTQTPPPPSQNEEGWSRSYSESAEANPSYKTGIKQNSKNGATYRPQRRGSQESTEFWNSGYPILDALSPCLEVRPTAFV